MQKIGHPSTIRLSHPIHIKTDVAEKLINWGTQILWNSLVLDQSNIGLLIFGLSHQARPTYFFLGVEIVPLMKIHFTHVMVAQWTTIKVKMIWQKRESISLVFGHDLHNVYGHTVIVKSPLHDTNASNLLRKAWLIIEMLLQGIHFF